MNHASREMLGRICIIDDTKFPCLLLASLISLDLQTVKVNFVSTKTDFVIVFRYSYVLYVL